VGVVLDENKVPVTYGEWAHGASVVRVLARGFIYRPAEAPVIMRVVLLNVKRSASVSTVWRYDSSAATTHTSCGQSQSHHGIYGGRVSESYSATTTYEFRFSFSRKVGPKIDPLRLL
jgi:hypothetical protein